MKRIYLLIGLLFFVVSAQSGTLELKSPLTPQQLESSAEVGSLGVTGIGKVTIIARRKGSQVIIKASGPDGKALGRAETTIGSSRTPSLVSVQKP